MMVSVLIAPRSVPSPALFSGLYLSSGGVQRFSLQSRSQTGSERGVPSTPAAILLIEDNRADVSLVRDALEEHGVEGELVVLPDGERGIQFIQDIESGAAPAPDLIILDLNLPRRSGREVLARIQQGPRSSQVPVVILSSSTMRQDKEEAARLGAVRYFSKPASLDDFMSLGAAFKQLLGGTVS
jgi:CheY-like chemotaxis protein